MTAVDPIASVIATQVSLNGSKIAPFVNIKNYIGSSTDTKRLIVGDGTCKPLVVSQDLVRSIDASNIGIYFTVKNYANGPIKANQLGLFPIVVVRLANCDVKVRLANEFFTEIVKNQAISSALLPRQKAALERVIDAGSAAVFVTQDTELVTQRGAARSGGAQPQSPRDTKTGETKTAMLAEAKRTAVTTTSKQFINPVNCLHRVNIAKLAMNGCTKAFQVESATPVFSRVGTEKSVLINLQNQVAGVRRKDPTAIAVLSLAQPLVV